MPKNLYRDKIKQLLASKEELEKQSTVLYQEQHDLVSEVATLQNLVIKTEGLLRTGAWELATQKDSVFLYGDTNDFLELVKFTKLGEWGNSYVYLDKHITLGCHDGKLHIQLDCKKAAFFIREWGLVVTTRGLQEEISKLYQQASHLKQVADLLKPKECTKKK